MSYWLSEIHRLEDWANYEFDKGNRKKAIKIMKIADKLLTLHYTYYQNNF